MKKHSFALALALSFTYNHHSFSFKHPSTMNSPDPVPSSKPFNNPGPMNNGEWFYASNNPCAKANDLHQEKKWPEAEKMYAEFIDNKVGSLYDQYMAQINRAACQTAQGKVAPGWQYFDDLMDIPKERQLPDNPQDGNGKTVLVTTKKIGLGDIVHFEEVLAELINRGYKPIFAVRNSEKFPFKDRFLGPAAHHGYQLIGDDEPMPETDYEATLPGLFGRLHMHPQDLCPKAAIYTESEETVQKVYDVVNPILSADPRNRILFIFSGDKGRAATLMGDRQLPRDPNAHGRHIDSEAVNALMRDNPHLYVIDGGFGASKFHADADVKGRVLPMPRDKAFDTFVGAAIAMNALTRIIGFGADNGPTNIFTRALSPEAQARMGIMIPNSKEYDMRMHGDETSPEYKKYENGERYQQFISKAAVYKCKKPSDQIAMLAQAYAELIKARKDAPLAAKAAAPAA